MDSTASSSATTQTTTHVVPESSSHTLRAEESTHTQTQSGATRGGRGQSRRRPNPNSRPTTPGNTQRPHPNADGTPADGEPRKPRQRTKRNQNRNRGEGSTNTNANTNTNSPADSGPGSGRSTPRPHPHPRASTNAGEVQGNATGTAQNHRNPGGTANTRPRRNEGGNPTPNQNQRNRQRKQGPHPSSSNDPPSTSSTPHQPSQNQTQNRRRANFGSSLTKPDSEPQAGDASSRSTRPKPNPRAHLPQGDDLTSSLIRGLSTPPYPDCLICFSPLRPEQAIWSCGPEAAVMGEGEASHTGTGTGQQYCWKSFHVKCIRSWAEKSVKDVREAWRARGEERSGDWRCPGCQVKREVVPSGYWCFCSSTSEPKPTRLTTPHSCGNTCSRRRPSEAQGGCAHPCPLTCHPGPCPPCGVTTSVECPCPRREVITYRCGGDASSSLGGHHSASGRRVLTCGKPCNRTLNCGKHRCEELCHEGECGRCEVREEARCWCGREEREVRCGEGVGVGSVVETGTGREEWVGRFGCDEICERPFDCQIHKCQKSCHTPSSTPAHCPLSPDVVTHCPCGKSRIAPPPSLSSFSSFSSPSTLTQKYAFPPRTSCTSPIPTCTHKCLKPHLACGHPCEATCHEGACPPCMVKISRPCRCGISVREVWCWEAYEEASVADALMLTVTPSGSGSGVGVGVGVGVLKEKEFLCDKPCPALRACGRHQCRRLCCPLAQLGMAAQSKKGKRRVNPNNPSEDPTALGVGEERGGLHECDLVCGKMLSCGNHRCEEKDHKGPCRPCLRSSFEEAICPCGRTILDPPIPCGTVIRCPHPCPIPMNPSGCGHVNSTHPCHDVSTTGCPPCVMLSERECACGKRRVMNVRCSLAREKIGCGVGCGKLLSCGFHHCDRLCHADACGPCTAPCGKSRKSCLPLHHPCTLPCHAPAACDESESCAALVQVTCACGRLKQSVRCKRTSASASDAPSSGSATTTATTTSLKCTTECQIAKRNARLADALGIAPEKRDAALLNMNAGAGSGNGVSYSDELVGFAKANMRFVGVVEKAFKEFVGEEGPGGAGAGGGTGTGEGGQGGGLKRHQVLPHMTIERRKFVHDLAAVYRMDTQMVDVEPNRSVQIIRRIDTRIPNPTLSAYVVSLSSGSSSGGGVSNPSASSSSLGKLADLRTLRPTTPSSTSSAFGSSFSSKPGPTTSSTANGGFGAGRGWTSIVSRTPLTSTSTTTAKQSASAWLQQPAEALNKPSWRSTTPTAAANVDGTTSTSGGGAYRPPHLVRAAAASAQAGAGAGAGVNAVSGSAGGHGSAGEDVPDDWEDDV